MKFLILPILGMFLFQGWDIPIKPSVNNPKTCCGRAICLCRHEKGATCPMWMKQKQALPPSAAKSQAHSGCAMHAKAAHPVEKQPKKIALAPKKVRRINSDRPFWQKAPCHQDSPRAKVSGFSKDFDHEFPRALRKVSKTSFLPHSQSRWLDLLTAGGIDRPPRVFSSF